ncbi:hypothetical protein X559_1591 [Paenilisteria newyorkensis]|nr:hypothetical protein X559_1591 [Listeria newyorkensis]
MLICHALSSFPSKIARFVPTNFDTIQFPDLHNSYPKY